MNALERVTRIAGCLICLQISVCFEIVGANDRIPPLHQQIDELVSKRHAELKLVPAGVSTDAEFLRRVTLDLTGIIPTAQQARAFLDDVSPDKRRRLIDELLAGPEYAIHMARVFDVMFVERRVPTISSYDVPAAQWRSYLTGAFAENRPWDQMVRDMLSSDGTDERHAAGVKFYLVRDVAPHQLTRDVGRLFLGIDLQCAQCHDDPRFDSYRQADYFGIYAFLQRVTAFRDDKKNVSLVGETAAGKTTFVSVFTAKSGDINPRLPGGEMIADPEIEKDKEYVVKPGPKQRGVPTYSRRLKLAEQLPRSETNGFSRNIANRMWAMLMGRGLVHPLDLHHAGNPPSSPELLNYLESWLVEHKYDLNALLRELLLTQTYQRSSVLPNGARELPSDAFAVAPLRGLSPEQLSWSLLQAVGRASVPPKSTTSNPATNKAEARVGNVAPQAVPIWQVRLKELEPLERQTRTMITVFAGLPGQPDGDFQPIVDQALHLLNHPTMPALIRDEPSQLIKRLITLTDLDALSDELYLSVLARRPTADEITQVRGVLESKKSPEERKETLTALIWGLLLSSEFRLNH